MQALGSTIKFMNVHAIKPIHVSDDRGEFCKVFHENSEVGPLNFEVNEVYATVSKIGVVRGLHFQLPPKSQSKLITVLQGSVFEVYVDLRIGSPNFGVPYTCTLSEPSNLDNESSLFIPSGFAHGYQVLSENTIVQYLANFPYDKELDAAISISSFEIQWPLNNMLLSEKDATAQNFLDFKSPYSI
jgi:dTDP-4-dehydrorhamnose 3,5-epimerase